MDSIREEIRMAGSGSDDYSDLGLGIPVDQVDSLVYKVIDSYQTSSKSLWKCAEYTWQLFDECGLYERRFTETLVNALSVQKDTIYHWRKAWDLRLSVLAKDPDFDVDGLSITHFYGAADFIERIGVEWVMDWLASAQEESWSSRKLAAEMDMATNDSGTAPWLYRKITKVTTKLERIWQDSEFSGLPDHKREKLQRIINMLKEIVE